MAQSNPGDPETLWMPGRSAVGLHCPIHEGVQTVHLTNNKRNEISQHSSPNSRFAVSFEKLGLFWLESKKVTP